LAGWYYHHGANEGVTNNDEGAGLLRKGRNGRQPKGGEQIRKVHEEEETGQEMERKK